MTKLTIANEEMVKIKSRILARPMYKQNGWRSWDEVDWLRGLGYPHKLPEDEQLRWKASRINQLLRYKNCLTLRSRWSTINKVSLNKALDKMINSEAEANGLTKDSFKKLVEKEWETFCGLNHIEPYWEGDKVDD